MVQLLGVVDEKAHLLLVRLKKMLCGNFQRLGHTFTNGNARHHNDKLAPAILLVQLEDGFDIAISLAGAGFHLDIEIDPADLGFDQFSRLRQVLLMLNLGDVLQQRNIGQL